MNKSLLPLFALTLAIIAIGCRNQSKSLADAHIQVVMKKYTIEPAVIHVKANQTTELEVSTADVRHGFDVPGLNIKEPVGPGQPAIITLKNPPKGEYKVVCGIICGPHHDDMEAKLIVD
ncbi:MAG TPA: cupredoxin domain-containing protein [Candidatus Angelobacter sp.]|jgi:cytochrome c oxidase subunit 2|nr:cupredoxin domain-containing protein [Candidatus Angelobacter sp.]